METPVRRQENALVELEKAIQNFRDVCIENGQNGMINMGIAESINKSLSKKSAYWTAVNIIHSHNKNNND